jgi:hypothetical protein
VYLPAPVLVDSAPLSFELLPGLLDCLPRQSFNLKILLTNK